MPSPLDTNPARKARPALRTLLRDAMRARGIETVDGQQGLARRAGVARNTIYAWEAGAYPRIGELERVGRFLGLPAWQLLQAWEAGDVVEGDGNDEAAPRPAWAEGLVTYQQVADLATQVQTAVTAEVQANREALVLALGRETADRVASNLQELLPRILAEASRGAEDR